MWLSLNRYKSTRHLPCILFIHSMLTVKLNELMGKNCERKEREKKQTKKKQPTNVQKQKQHQNQKPVELKTILENKCFAVSMVFFNSSIKTNNYPSRQLFSYLDYSACQ